MAEIALAHVCKVFADGTVALHDFSLAIADGEFLVCVGPSGCGKTTLLRLIAGLETAGNGDICIGGKRVNDIPPERRDVAMVFQSYALYPHMNVAENLAFPLSMRGMKRDEIKRRVAEVAELLRLGPLLERKPAELSGGQRQRVAMGRALVRNPAVFLMDEPLSNLDAKLRVHIRAEISALQKRLGTTTLYVTHDQVEAMTMGERVAVMRAGRLEQVAAPDELYRRPANVFVAGFLGHPGMNVFVGRITSMDGLPTLAVGGKLLPVDAARLTAVDRLAAGESVLVGVRPEHLHPAADGIVCGEVRAVEPLGHETLVHVATKLACIDCDGYGLGTEPFSEERHGMITARLRGGMFHPGMAVCFVIQIEHLHLFDMAGRALD